MQPKHLTRAQYFKHNKLPFISICRKLQSELPVMTHLIQALPSPVPEIQKINSKHIDSNKTNLELANALKIIHELEFELETMASRFNQTQEELLLHQNHSKQLSRQIQRNEQIIISLQSTIQKNQFSTKAKLEFEKDYHSSILIQYEKRIEDMNTAYDQLKNSKEKELLDAKIFHQENINKVEIRVREFESQSQEDTKKVQKELQKAILLNSQFRQKLADIQTFNQEHIRNLQKTNTELLQTNMRLKTQLQHKLQAVQTSFQLSENKARELLNTIKIFENRLENQKNAWKDQKKCLIEQNLQNQKIWKNNYYETSKQKDRVLQELNKKTILLGEKEREEANLKQNIKSLERFIGQLSQQKIKILEDSQRAKKQLTQNNLLNHHLKIDEIQLQNERFLSQEMKRAINSQRRSLEERFSTQVAKYVEQIRILQTQKLQDSHSVRLSQDCSRKLQVKIDQMKIEIQYLNKHSQQYSESFQNKAKVMDEQFLYKLYNEQKKCSNEIQKLRSEKQLQEQRIKQKFEQNIRELNKTIQQKSKEMRQAHSKCNQLNNDKINERANFILRIQQLQLNVEKCQTHNQNLLKLNHNLTQKVISLQDQCRSQQKTAHEQINIRMRIAQELSSQIQNVKTLKDYISQKQRQSTNFVGHLKAEIFNKKRIIERYQNESQRLETTISDLKFRLENVERQNKTLQQEKQRQQMKLIEKDTSSEENWRILEADQKEKTRKMNTEYQTRQTDLKSIIKQKELIIEKQTAVIKDLQEDIDCEKNKNEHLSVTWQIKCRQFEEANRKLLKSSFTVQDLQKQNSGKDTTLNNLLKDVQRYRNENEQKKKSLAILQNQNFDLKNQLNKLNFENERLRNSINQLENQNKSLEDEFETHKERMSSEFAQLKQSQVSKIHELQKWERDLMQLKVQLQETNQIYQKVELQKRKALQNIQTLQRQLQLVQHKLKSNKKESIYQISELTATKLQLEQKLKQTGQKLQQQANEQQNTIEKNKQQLEMFSRMLKQYENSLLQKIQELETAHINLQQQKMSSSTTKAQIEQLKKDKKISEQKIESLINEIECLKKQKLTFERQLTQAYEQYDQKLQQNKEQLAKLYDNLLRQKTEKVEILSMRFSELSQNQRSQWQSRYQESYSEKEEKIRQLSLIKDQLTCLRNQFDSLKLELEQKKIQLSLYKSKWALIFGNVKQANDSIENSIKHEKERNNQNIRMNRLQTRSQIQRTERSEIAYKTSYGAKHSPENYFKKARQSTTFENNRYERQFVNDFNENQRVDDNKQEVDLTINEAVIFSKLTFNKQKEQQNGRREQKQNSSINSNFYPSNQFDV